MNKKDLLIKAYQLKNQGKSRDEVIALLKSVDIKDYKTYNYLYNDVKQVRYKYGKPGTFFSYYFENDIDYIKYVIDFCKDRFSKLDRNIDKVEDLIMGILEHYYLDYKYFKNLPKFIIGVDKSNKIYIDIFIGVEDVPEAQPVRLYDRNGLYIKINCFYGDTDSDHFLDFKFNSAKNKHNNDKYFYLCVYIKQD